MVINLRERPSQLVHADQNGRNEDQAVDVAENDADDHDLAGDLRREFNQIHE